MLPKLAVTKPDVDDSWRRRQNGTAIIIPHHSSDAIDWHCATSALNVTVSVT